MARESFSAEERAAMKERAKELKVGKSREAGEKALLAKVAAMPETDRVIAERLHAIVTEVAPELEPKTWYGQPAYAKDGKVLCFFQSAAKFKTRYATLGFNDVALLDDGSMWPTAFAMTQMTEANEELIRKLLQKAVR